MSTNDTESISWLILSTNRKGYESRSIAGICDGVIGWTRRRERRRRCAGREGKHTQISAQRKDNHELQLKHADGRDYTLGMKRCELLHLIHWHD